MLFYPALPRRTPLLVLATRSTRRPRLRTQRVCHCVQTHAHSASLTGPHPTRPSVPWPPSPPSRPQPARKLSWPLPVPKKSLALPPPLLTRPQPRIPPKTARSRESQWSFGSCGLLLYSDIPPLVSASPSLFPALALFLSLPHTLTPTKPSSLQFLHHFFLSPASFPDSSRKFHVMRSTRSAQNRANVDPLQIRRQSQSQFFCKLVVRHPSHNVA